jgi:hypothetical protein
MSPRVYNSSKMSEDHTGLKSNLILTVRSGNNIIVITKLAKMIIGYGKIDLLTAISCLK